MSEDFVIASLGVFVGALGVLFTAGAIVASVLLYRQSKEYKEKISVLLGDMRLNADNDRAKQRSLFEELLQSYRTQLAGLPAGSEAEQLKERIDRVEAMTETRDWDVETYQQARALSRNFMQTINVYISPARKDELEAAMTEFRNARGDFDWTARPSGRRMGFVVKTDILASNNGLTADLHAFLRAKFPAAWLEMRAVD